VTLIQSFSRMKDSLRSINNIHFVICLAILLLNDFYLKAEFHNWLTGKLSDFCGLFAFASFWSALFPQRKVLICIATGLLFVIWKSSYSQTFIDLFNENVYTIDRVIDVTDLIALPILLVVIFHSPERAANLKLNPLPLALLTLISFCATSVPQVTQKFAQPQFILFKAGIVEFKDEEYPSRYRVYHFDSLIIIRIEQIRIDRQGAMDDDFHKTQILSDVDLRLLRDSQRFYSKKDSISDYAEMRNALTVNGRTSIVLEHDSVIDELNFRNTRLDGTFKRLKKDQPMIEGRFVNGIEDSIWTWYEAEGKIFERKYFTNGELMKTEQFENGHLLSAQSHKTRDDIVTNKYFHLAVLSLLIISVLSSLVLTLRKSEKKDIIILPNYLSALGIVGLPFIVLVLARLISSWIPYSRPDFFLDFFIEAFFIYITTAPLFVFVFAAIKLRTRIDLILYILLFSLSTVLIKELIYVRTLI
jgi:hypothetical protein